MLSNVRRLGKAASVNVRSLSSVAATQIDAQGANAVVFGGFGFGNRQMKKHEALYTEHGFSTTPVLSTVTQLSSPYHGDRRGKQLAEKLMEKDEELVLHAISGSVWTMIYMLHHMDPAWRDEKVKAIMFDSSPPKSDIYAFGGWLAFATKQPVMKNLAFIFEPYRMYQGINSEWEAGNHARMFGPAAVIPRSAHCLFIQGRNDPVLDTGYVDSFMADVREHAKEGANVQSVLFEKARHAMAVVENPEEYKGVHVENLLAMVPNWNGGASKTASTSNSTVKFG